MRDKIYIGKLGKTVGLDGSIKIYLESDFPNQFKKGASFTTNKSLTLTVKSFLEKRDTVLFEEFNTVNDAKKLINQELYTTIEATRESCLLKESEFYWFDLIKCKIVENKSLTLGEVKDIQRFPGGDYFEVQTSFELQEKGLPKLFLIPYIDMYIEKVDIQNRVIYTKDCLGILENS